MLHTDVQSSKHDTVLGQITIDIGGKTAYHSFVLEEDIIFKRSKRVEALNHVTRVFLRLLAPRPKTNFS